MCELVNCCFCCTLRTGSIFIGYFNLVFTILVLIFYVLSCLLLAGAFLVDAQHVNANNIDLTPLIFLFTLLVVIVSVLCAIVALLIHGIQHGKPKYILPWLILCAIEFVCMFADLLFTMIKMFHDPQEVVLLVLVKMIIFALSVYFFSVVLSFYREMKREQRHYDVNLEIGDVYHQARAA